MKKILFVLVYLKLVSACGGNSSDNNTLPTFKEIPYVDIDSENLSMTDNSISGAGSIILENPLGTVKSNIKAIKKPFLIIIAISTATLPDLNFIAVSGFASRIINANGLMYIGANRAYFFFT